MALVAYRQFRGEIPRVEPHLLPAGAAQEARNCVFTAGVLQSTRDGLYLRELQANPVRGLYTDDGINFHSWSQETRVFRSPIKEDVHNRLYFLTLEEGVMKVTSRLNMAPDGPVPLPSNCFRVGVPTPTQAPELTLVDRTTVPGYENLEYEAYAWWDDAGRRFGYTQVQLLEVAKFKRYTFAPPAKPQNTPDYAVLRCILVARDREKTVMQVTLDLDDTKTSNTFDGGQEYTLTQAEEGGTCTIKIEWGAYATVAYQFTVRNQWNEESGPSPAATVRPTFLQDVKIVAPLPDFSGFKPFDSVRVYRTYGTTATFLQVDVRAAEAGSYLDDSRQSSAQGLAITTTEYEPPPTGLQGAELGSNGVFAYFKDNQLYLSEPYLPHAASYIYTFKHSIRSVLAAQQAFVVTTAAEVYLLAGVSPGAMQQYPLMQPQAGIAQRSIVDVDGGAVYASGDGLVVVNGSATSTELSQQLFGREVWRKRYGDMVRDASLRLSFHDGHLLASSDRHDKGFVLRLDENVASLAQHTQRMDCTFQLPVEDALYYSVGRSLYQFQAGLEQEFYWHGRDEVFAQGEVFGAGYLRASGPVLLMLWCDGRKVYEQTIAPGHFRLPASMPRCLRLSVAMRGIGKVQELCLARSMTELRHG